jgi:hypothetical protein
MGGVDVAVVTSLCVTLSVSDATGELIGAVVTV